MSSDTPTMKAQTHVPLAQVKLIIRNLPDDELPAILTEIVRLCVQKDILSGRSVGAFAQTIESQVKGL